MSIDTKIEFGIQFPSIDPNFPNKNNETLWRDNFLLNVGFGNETKT